MPQYGQHRAGGTVVELPLFWAINNYMDSYHLANDLMLEEIRLALRDGELATEFAPELVLQTLRGAIFGVCAVWRYGKPERSEIPSIVEQLFRMYV